ncbi:hypothetical protein FO519_001722 [Halicephalobus sp. NKZ332]|nr:hypothetical protein FO519_001722 [Halicephalobus sp. NKZ332]
MSKYCLKKPSKRQASKRKFKIVKKIREHNKKVRRDAKKKGHYKGAEKLIEIPNNCPFKEELQLEAELRREQVKVEKQRKKEELKAFREDPGRKPKFISDVPVHVEDNTVANPEVFPLVHHDHYVVEPKELIGDKNDKSTRIFAAEVRKTIEAADIIIEVLDARDPLGSRNRAIEKSVIEQGKRLILLLNKIDLVPKDNVLKWLKYLRQELPTIAFKASTQEQAKRLGRYHKSVLLEDVRGSKCVGAELVMSVLANYCRNKDIKTSVRVGVVGYPNVGKSSIINSLKRTRACNTGATPGVTRTLQEVQLDKHIRLIDSPGVVLASKEQFDPVEIALKNALRVEALDDPISPVVAILRRCSVQTLMMHFNIGQFSDADGFLSLVAKKFGKLKKGGRPDINAAAKCVLQAWNSGKLRYHTEPPEAAKQHDAVCTSEILTTFSKEFDLDDIDDSKLVEELPDDYGMVVDNIYDPSKPRTDALETDVAMDDDDTTSTAGKVVVTGKKKEKKVQFSEKDEKVPLPKSFEINDCSAGWQSVDLSYVPTLAACGEMEEGGGIPCKPDGISVCTGRNPFCAQMEDRSTFKCCSDIVQDSTDVEMLQPEQIKPVCPNGAIPFKIPQVMLCDPAIVNICPYDYTCVEAENGHILPPDSRSLCCKTSTLYSFGKVFWEAQLTPRIVPHAPLSGVQYTTLNVHTSALIHSPEIRTGDHFVLSPYKILEPAFIKKVILYQQQTKGSYLHVIMFDPNSRLENFQLYYDRICDGGKEINLEEPIPDGGFINKRVVNGPPQTNPEQELKSNYRKMWVVLVYKTVDPLTRLYTQVSSDLNNKYRNAVEFLRSSTAQRLGTPIAGSYFYVGFSTTLSHYIDCFS